MLRSLRERTKTILWIVVLTFVISIFAIWGMDLSTPSQRKYDQDVAGIVDKEEITQQSYSDMANQLFYQLRQEKGENYNPSEMERSLLEDQAWELTVQNTIMQREIAKLKLGVTDAELVAFLRQNPHPQLQSVFKTESGEFDYQAYLKALADPSVDWTELERWGRSVIPEIKLQSYLLAQVHISEKEILDRFKERNETMKARYVEIAVQQESTPYEPSADEIAAYYETKKEDFKDPEMRRLRIIEVDKLPTAADEEDARIRLADLRSDIVDGTSDFATLAKEYSEDNATADKGGDLGFLAKGSMAPEFDAVAFSLKPGEISQPFRTEHGYHLLTVLERKTEKGVEQVRASHILVKPQLGSDTVDSLQAMLRDLSMAISKEGFEKIAAARGLKTFDTPPFPRGMFIKDIGFVPRLSSFAFNYKTGNVSYGIDTETKVYFAKIIEEIPARTKPMEEVRSALVDGIRADRATGAAKTVAESMRREMLAGGDFDAIARAKGFAVKETGPFKKTDAIPGIGASTNFSTACTYLAPGAVSPPVPGQGKIFLIKLVERTEPDMKLYTETRQTIAEELRNESAQRFMANWYQGLREKAKVEDLREKALD